MEDARLAVETGVDGLDVVIGTSSFLREHSHGKSMAYITKTALEVIEYIKSKGLEVRCEFTILHLQASSVPYTTSKSCDSSCLSNPISALTSKMRRFCEGR
jgi:isopropylmalate/homocitrate/citramalate synthase